MERNWKRTFYIIWTGQFLSLLSSSAVNFAIIIWLSLETGSAEVLAFTAIAALMPQAIVGPLAGIFIDRWDRKTTMILADAFIAISTLAMSLLYYLGELRLEYIYILLALRSIGSASTCPPCRPPCPFWLLNLNY